MQAVIRSIVDGLDSSPPPLSETELDQGKELLCWLADDHFTFLGYREYKLEREGEDDYLRGVPGTGLGILRADQDMSAGVRQAATPGEGEGPREDPAGAGEGQLALHGAPARLPRLRRREVVRRVRRGGGGATLPRAVLECRLHRVADQDPAAAGEGRRRAAVGRLRRQQPCRQGVDGHPGELPARRALPDPPRRAGPDRRGGDVHPGASTAAAVHPARRLRPLSLLPCLPAAGALQHRSSRTHQRDPQGSVERGDGRLHHPHQRVHHRPGALRRTTAQGRGDPRGRHRGPGATADRRGPLLARGLRRRRHRGVRRGGRCPADQDATPTRSPRPTRRTSRRVPARSTSVGSRRSVATSASISPSTSSSTRLVARPG